MTRVVDDFKAAFRRHAAGVALVVCQGPDGPRGITASSVASVSAAPPMLSFSVLRSSKTAAALVPGAGIHVVLLGEQHRHLATDFATTGAPRFTAEQGWKTSGTLPELPSAPATLRCRLAQLVPAGESWLALGEVTDVDLGRDGRALVHHDRTYVSLGTPLGHPRLQTATVGAYPRRPA
jgi:flavin reductase (DIM6/NTAB) family NADH-FMN oxidoreductase RutF